MNGTDSSEMTNDTKAMKILASHRYVLSCPALPLPSNIVLVSQHATLNINWPNE